MRKRVVSLDVSVASFGEFVSDIMHLAGNRYSSYVCVANVHMAIEAHWNASFATSVNNANFVTPDGMPIAKSLGLLYGVQQERVAGMDLLPQLLQEAEKRNYGVFFYGGTEEMLDQTRFFVESNYPKIENHNYLSPPFRALSPEEETDIVTRINHTEANLVFVILGCPKQEVWMSNMNGRIHACMIGIGGALPVMIGMQRRAPLWMQNLGFEWLYRLYREPRRLFKRYFVTNSLFIYLFCKQYIKTR